MYVYGKPLQLVVLDCVGEKNKFSGTNYSTGCKQAFRFIWFIWKSGKNGKKQSY